MMALVLAAALACQDAPVQLGMHLANGASVAKIEALEREQQLVGYLVTDAAAQRYYAARLNPHLRADVVQEEAAIMQFNLGKALEPQQVDTLHFGGGTIVAWRDGLPPDTTVVPCV